MTRRWLLYYWFAFLLSSEVMSQSASTIPEIHFRHGLGSDMQYIGYSNFPQPSVVIISALRRISYFSANQLEEYNSFYSAHLDTKLYAKLVIKDSILIAADSTTGVLKIINLLNDRLVDSIPGFNLKGHFVFSSDLRFIFFTENNKLAWFNLRTREGRSFNMPTLSGTSHILFANYFVNKRRVMAVSQNDETSLIIAFSDSGKILLSRRVSFKTNIKITDSADIIAVESDGTVSKIIASDNDIKGRIEEVGTLPDNRIKENIISNDGKYIFMNFYGVNSLKKIFIWDINSRHTIDTIQVNNFNYIYEPSCQQLFSRHSSGFFARNEDNSNPNFLTSYNIITKTILRNNTSNFSSIIGFDYSPDAKLLALLNDHLEIKIYDLNKSKILTLAYAKDRLDFTRGDFFNLNDLIFSPHGQYLIKFSNFSFTVWNTNFSPASPKSMRFRYPSSIYPSQQDSIIFIVSNNGFGRFNVASFKTISVYPVPFKDSFEWNAKIISEDVVGYFKTIGYNKDGKEIRPENYNIEPWDTFADSIYFYSLGSGKLLKKMLTIKSNANAAYFGRYTFDKASNELIINDDVSTQRINMISFEEQYDRHPNTLKGLYYAFANGNEVSTWDFYNHKLNKHSPLRNALNLISRPPKLDSYIRIINFDSRHFFSLSQDGSFKIMNSETGEEELSVVSFDSPNPKYADNWLYVTSAGFFDGTNAVLNQFYWQDTSGTRYSYDKFYETFYTPNLLFHVLQHNLETKLDLAYYTRIPGLQELLNANHAKYITGSKGDYLCIPDIDDENPIAHLPPDPNIEINTRDKECKIKIKIPLQTAHDFNSTKTIKQTNADSLYYFKNHRKGNLHFIPYAIGDYPSRSELGKLPFSQISELNFFKIFDSMYMPFKAEFDTVFYDATRPDNLKTLDDIFNTYNNCIDSIKPEDLIILYFSGHGVIPFGSQMFYFLPYDGVATDENSLKQTALSAATIADFPTLVKANRVLIIIDACQSGGTLNSFAKAGVEKSLNNPYASTAIIASSSPIEFSAQNERGSELSSIISGIIRQAIKDRKSLTVKELVEKVNSTPGKSKFLQTRLGIVTGIDFPLLSF